MFKSLRYAAGGVASFLEEAAEDVRAVRRGDPAAVDSLEVVLTYPGLHALWSHRVAHQLHRVGNRRVARALSHVSRHYTGIEIHPGATIGRRVFIDHGMGVVIGETAVIGDDCLIYKGVVLGGTSLRRTKRHPTLGRGVIVGTNAAILGAVEVGDGARIGSGSVVVRDVPEGATVVGIPARLVARATSRDAIVPDLNHADIPDPIQRQVASLLAEIDRLAQRVGTLEHQLDLEPEQLAERLGRDSEQSELDGVLAAAYEDDKVLG